MPGVIRRILRCMTSKTDAEQQRQNEATWQSGTGHSVERRRASSAVLWLFLVLVAVAVGMLAMLYVVRRAGTETAFGGLATRLLGRNAEAVSAPVVINRIQRLSRLETISYSVDTVVEGKRTNAVLPDLLFGDRLLLVVHGQVIAGVDLSRLKPESVTVNGRSVSVDLPSSQIFTTRIDEHKSRVFARTTGVLMPTDPNLETETRRTAETQIEQAAMGDGILDTARANARGSVESLLRGLGFETVTVR